MFQVWAKKMNLTSVILKLIVISTSDIVRFTNIRV